MRRVLFFVSIIFLCICLNAQTTRFVAQDATGSGTSWADASGDLQAMIEASDEGDIILVKQGLYKPQVGTPTIVSHDVNWSNTSNRDQKSRAFFLKRGVKIYGGCTGSENSPEDRPSGDELPVTILSGTPQSLAIGSEPSNPQEGGSENCAYHVIIGLGDITGTLLDGITIQNAKSYRSGGGAKTNKAVINDRDGNPYDVYYLSGGGIYLSNSPNSGALPLTTSITLNNILIKNCNSIGETSYAPTDVRQEQSKGAGIYANNINIDFSNLSLKGNVARSGAGLYISNAYSFTGTNLLCEENAGANGNGVGVCIENVESVTITNLTLNNNKFRGTNQDTNGGGMYNKGITTLTLNGLINISNNISSYGSGGGIYNEDINMFIATDIVNITGNQTRNNGGGIYNYNVNNFMVPNITISNNTATNGYGGGIYIEQVPNLTPFETLTLINNSSKRGGGLYLKGIWQQTTLEIDNFICTENSSTATSTSDPGHGGGVYTEQIDVIKINKLTLNENTVSGNTSTHGGGIYTAGSSDQYISLLKINELISCKGNISGGHGGAFYNQYLTKFEFINEIEAGVISGNKATSSSSDGGAIYNEYVTIFKTNLFRAGGGNTAGRNGGALYITNTHIEIPVIEIGDGVTANTATSNGGGIYCINSTWNDFERLVLKKNTTITTSSTTNGFGGGIYIHGNNWTHNLTVNELIADGNMAGRHGGGIYTTEIDQIKIQKLTLINNSTIGAGSSPVAHGGGIYTAGNSAHKVGLLSINKIVECNNNSAQGNGGAFYNYYIDNILFSRENDMLIANNTATNGGGMYNEYVSNLILPDNSTFNGNIGTISGGAMYNTNMPDFFANHITFNNNSATGSITTGMGGAVHFKTITGNITIEDLIMKGNRTNSGAGPGMYFTGITGDITINKIFAEDNKMLSDGNDSNPGGGTFCFVSNGVTNETSTITLRNGVIKDSYAYSHGGGLYVEAASRAINNLVLYNMEFNNCRTISNIKNSDTNDRGDGGAIYIPKFTPITSTAGKVNAYFTDIHVHNTFTSRDGGIYFGRTTNDIILTTDKFDYNRIENNYSRGEAPGARVWHAQGEVLIENTIFQENTGGMFDEIADFGYGNGVSCTGGGLYTRKSKGVVRNCKFIKNKIWNGGSGFYCAESQFNLSDLLFEGNYAGTNGGGFYADAGAEANGTPSTGGGRNLIFRNNESRNGGGVMYYSQATIHFVDIYCSGNKAGTNGGVIHADNQNTKLYFYNAYFIGNSATTKGGVLYTSSSCRYNVFVNAQFTGNYSNNGQGSVVYYADPSVADNTFINCTFSNNFANTANANQNYVRDYPHYYGQPINVESGSTGNTSSGATGGKFYNCIFYNNKNSGDILDYDLRGNSSSNRTTFTNCHFTSASSYNPSSLANVTFTNTTTGNPVFVNPVDTYLAPTSLGDYRLDRDLSPCIDAGDNDLFNTEYNSRWATFINKLDLDYVDRIQAYKGSQEIIDLGPFEGPGNAIPRTCLWYGAISTDWNVPGNWLNNIVPDNGDNIGFHPEAIRDLLVPDNYKDGNSTEITVNDINNRFSNKDLVLNRNKLNIEGALNFNVTQNYIDARQIGSNLNLKGTSDVNQDLKEKLLVNNAVYNLTLNRTLASGLPEEADIKVTKLRIINELKVNGDGRLDAGAERTTITYGVDVSDSGNPDYSGYPTKADENVQNIENNQFRNETIYDLDIDNAKGVNIHNGQGDETPDILTISNDLTINADAKMIILADAGMTVKHMVYNDAGTDGLLIKTGTSNVNGKLIQTAPTGTFIFYNPEDYPVYGSVEFFQKGSYDANGATGYKYKWQYFTVPVREISALPTFAGTAIRKWNEKHDHQSGTPYWEDITDSSVLYSYNGYEITAVNPMLLTIKGILENRDYKNVLTYTPYNPEDFPGWHNGEITDQEANEGQHVIGNSYLAPIEIENINFEDNIEKTVYIFNTGSFMEWHDSGRGQGGYDNNPGQYIVIPQELAGEEVIENGNVIFRIPSQIPPMQAFSVFREKDGTDEQNTFKLNYSSATIGNKNNTFLRSSKKKKRKI